MSVFSDKLRECRKEKGYTQEKLCEILNISRDTLSKWENGSRCPDLNELCRICDTFECDLDYLTGRIEHRTNALQITCDTTGLSIASVKLLQEWNAFRSEPVSHNPFTNEYIRSDIDYLDNLLVKYPELLYYIDQCLSSMNTDTDISSNQIIREKKTLCMKIAVKLWNYITTGKKHHSLKKENVSKFASDFIYERISFLENNQSNSSD